MILSISRIFDGLLTIFDKAMVAIASLALFLIMVLIFFDAMFRYLLNSPLTFTFDFVTLYLMSAALLSVLSYTLRHGGHISIDLFAKMMNRRIYLVLIGLALLAGTVVCAIIAWETTWLSLDSWERGEVMTGIYAWPLWASKALVAMSFIGLTLRLFHCGLFNLLAGLVNEDELAVPILHDPSDPEGEI